jgi:sigma-B regulation protein RsbU (phosphoserine phosphatase)
MANHSILLMGMSDPEVALRELAGAGHRVSTAPGPAQGIESLDNAELDLVYLQPRSDDRAIEELRQVLAHQPDLAVVLVCATPSTPLTLEAWRNGAADILFQPLTPEALQQSLNRASNRTVSRALAGNEAVQARFRYFDDAGKEQWIAIVPPRFTIGRGSNNDLVLAKMNVSRAQAEVILQDTDYLLRDLGSKHGTFVNGTRIEQAVLSHGDRIRVGGLQGQVLTFHKGDLLQSLLAGTGSKADSGISVHGFREMGMLLSTFHALSSIPLLDDLLNLVVDNAIEVTGAERGFIMLKESDGNLSFRCARNAHKQPLDGSSFQTSRRVPDEVFHTGRRVVINDLDLDSESEDHSSTRRLGVRSISCVPLRYLPFRDSGGLSQLGAIETIGVLYVDSANIGGGLSQGQIEEALDTLASEAAMAIQHARLYKESQVKRKLEEELAIAREIQQALLPASGKTLHFMNACSVNLPCHEVGGDYFDYFDMDQGRLGFAVGDVAGKGMSAALLAAMLQGIFCAQTLLNLPLPSMIANVNCSLARRGTGSRFVTFFFGILDAEGNCTYTNAGHNPPILIRPDGSMRELTEGGMVLGLFPKAEYEARTVKMEPGDHLVLFTDGLLEARNTTGEEFGEERVRDLLRENAKTPADVILTRLQEELASFSANAPQHDDITMMVLGFRETPA